MKELEAVNWLRKHYDYIIESYPVQQDCTTYYYIPLYEAKDIIKKHSALGVVEEPLRRIKEEKTLFSGINSKDFAKIDLYKFANIIKDYI